MDIPIITQTEYSENLRIMASGVRFTSEQFIKAIPGTGGIVSAIAKRVGCDWHTCRAWIDKHPTIKRIYDDEHEGILDLAEAKLIEAIKGGDLGAIKYYLGTQGKQRGYVERQEMTGANGEAIPVKFIEVVKDYGSPDKS